MILEQADAIQSDDYFYDGKIYSLQRSNTDQGWNLYVLNEVDDVWVYVDYDHSDYDLQQYYNNTIISIIQENSWIA